MYGKKGRKEKMWERHRRKGDDKEEEEPTYHILMVVSGAINEAFLFHIWCICMYNEIFL